MSITLKAFTLIEIFCTFLIVSIVLTFSVMLGSDLIARYTAKIDVDNFVNRLAYAHSAALTHGVAVTICPRGKEQRCGNDWRQGQLLFIDYDRDHQFGNDDHLLGTFPALSHNSSLTWRGLGQRNYLIMDPLGVADADAGHFAYAHLPSYGKYNKHIIVNRTGRVRVVTS